MDAVPAQLFQIAGRCGRRPSAGPHAGGRMLRLPCACLARRYSSCVHSTHLVAFVEHSRPRPLIVRRTDLFDLVQFLFLFGCGLCRSRRQRRREGRQRCLPALIENLRIIVLFVDPRLGDNFAFRSPQYLSGQNRVLIVLVELLERIPTEHRRRRSSTTRSRASCQ